VLDPATTGARVVPAHLDTPYFRRLRRGLRQHSPSPTKFTYNCVVLTIGTREKVLYAEGDIEDLMLVVERTAESLTPEEKADVRQALRETLLNRD
jgi:hypothetical protein